MMRVYLDPYLHFDRYARATLGSWQSTVHSICQDVEGVGSTLGSQILAFSGWG